MAPMSATPVEVVQKQLDDYNRRDLAAFISNYSDDIVVYRLPATEPSLVGKAAFARAYQENRFNLPALHAELVNRIAFGNKVIDHERVTGIRDEPIEVAAAYEVRGGLIVAAWFLSGE
jgi:hypothetical protein